MTVVACNPAVLETYAPRGAPSGDATTAWVSLLGVAGQAGAAATAGNASVETPDASSPARAEVALRVTRAPVDQAGRAEARR